MLTPLRIATRESPLALWQAKHVQERLQFLHPKHEVILVPMTTRGDQILDRTLSKVGGKGLFIRELEQALLDHRADLAVHSLKDIPMELPEPFHLAAMLARENPYDAFVSPRYETLMDMPSGAKVGTASLRRTAILRQRYPHLLIETLRGNLNTRLKKLDDNHYDAIILACAGLLRLGVADRIRQILPSADFLPSPGQGTIGIEIRKSDTATQTLLQPLICAETTLCCSAERAFAKVLEGGCEAPLAAYAVLKKNQLTLEGWVAEPDGNHAIRLQQSTHFIDVSQVDLAIQLGQSLAQSFIDKGAQDIIERARYIAPTHSIMQ